MKQNMWPWGGKIFWVMVVLAVGTFTLTGISLFLDDWERGTIGVYLDVNEANEVTLEPVAGREAEAAGIQADDILLAVNGAALPGGVDVDGAQGLLSGPAGGDVTLTVRSLDGTEKTLTITRSQKFMEGLRGSGLTLSVLAYSYLALGLLASFFFLALSAWRFWRGSLSVVSALIAFVLLFMPYSLNLSTATYLGADAFGLYWLYAFVRTCGLLSIALFLFLFPSGTFIPAWGRWVAGAVTLWTILFLAAQLIPNLIPFFIVDWVWILVFAFGIVAQVLRYRTVTTESGSRSEQKRILVAGVIVLAAYIILWLGKQFLPLVFFESAGGIWYSLVSEILWVGTTVYLGAKMAFSD